MRKETEFDLVGFTKMMRKEKIPYLLIGRWALILYGAPLMTADYDFWIDPSLKEKLLKLLDSKGYEVPATSSWKHPIITVFAGAEKVDLLFFRKITNAEGQTLTFGECFHRAEIKEDKKNHVFITVPTIDDLILLKKIQRTTAEEEIKDRMDIRYLEKMKRTTE